MRLVTLTNKEVGVTVELVTKYSGANCQDSVADRGSDSGISMKKVASCPFAPRDIAFAENKANR